MQPVQLSLLPEQLPPPPNQLIGQLPPPDQLIGQLPPPQLQEAISQLAQLIAKMTAARRREADDE